MSFYLEYLTSVWNLGCPEMPPDIFCFSSQPLKFTYRPFLVRATNILKLRDSTGCRIVSHNANNIFYPPPRCSDFNKFVKWVLMTSKGLDKSVGKQRFDQTQNCCFSNGNNEYSFRIKFVTKKLNWNVKLLILSNPALFGIHNFCWYLQFSRHVLKTICSQIQSNWQLIQYITQVTWNGELRGCGNYTRKQWQ